MRKYVGQQSEYLRRKEKYKKIHTKQKRIINLISNIRVLIFLLGFSASVILFFMKDYRLSGIIFVLTLPIFVFLVIKHGDLKKDNEFICHLVIINQESLDRINGKWVDFIDTGEEYIDKDHPYSIDLDIFGKGSVFQWLNSTGTYLGREKLKDSLLNPCKDIKKIRLRQKAIMELGEKLDWRQHFQAEGRLNIESVRDPSSLIKWSENIDSSVDRRYIVFLLRLLPVITVISIIAYFLLPSFSIGLPLGLIFLNLVINFFSYKRVNREFETTSVYRNRIAVYQNLLEDIEKEEYESRYLLEMRDRLFNTKGNSASQKINGLKKLVERMDLRYNALFHFIINNLVLWDYKNLFALNKWKKESGNLLRSWLQIIAEFEELSSFALIKFDNPDWSMPQLVKKPYTLSARELGHPLLHRKERVSNNLKFDGAGNILIITGSNMSGKSTFLRTVGVNLILAYAGAPVCAGNMECSVMDIYSSMRVNDNLEKSISSFYAELLRIKMIIEAADKNEPMLFLIDEIFRGTNSKDRHIGAERVIKNLGKAGVMGLVSTHDLELGRMEESERLNIRNYHFEERYTEENRIEFDYKLHPGVSTTSNAIYLMKMIGIEVD